MPSKDELGKRLVAEIKASLDAQQSRHERWHQGRRMYYNEHDGPVQPYEGAFNATYPLTTQIVDRLGASVVDIITGSDPYCYPTCYTDGDAQDVVERAVQFFMEMSGFREAMKQMSPVAAWSNKAWVKTLWDEKKNRFKYRVIEPFNTYVYPAYVETLGEASSFGDRIVRRRSQIELMMDDGRYDKVELPGNGGGDLTEFSKSQGQTIEQAQVSHGTQSKPSPDDKFTVYDCMVSEGENWNRVSVLYPSGVVLKIDEWKDGVPFSRSEYGFKPTVPDHGYWPPVSVVNDMAQYQLDYDAAWCNFHNAAMMQAYPAVIASGGIESSKSLAKYGPGEVIEGDTDKVFPLQPSIDVSVFAEQMERAKQGAEEVSRVSSLIMGDGGGNKTATQSEGEQQWQAQMVNEYIRAIGSGVLQAADFHQAVLYEFFDKWQPVYGAHLEVEPGDKEKFAMPMVWNLSVESVEGTAMSQMAMIDGLAAYAADPEYGVDKYGLMERRLKTMDRRGVTDATSLQIPLEPNAVVSQMAEKLGIPADILTFHVDAAVGEAQEREIARLQELERLDGDPDFSGAAPNPFGGGANPDGEMQAGGTGGVPGPMQGLQSPSL